MHVPSLGQEDPLEEGMVPTAVFLPGESHGQRRLVGYSPWDCKELDTTEQLTPVVRTLHSHCEGSGLIPGQGTRRSHKPWCGPKKKYFF